MGRFFRFSGRVGRSAYWMVVVAQFVLGGIFTAWLVSLDPWELPQAYTTYTGETYLYWGTTGTKVVFGLFTLAWILLTIIGLSVSVRRWHDLDKSGWWVFIGLVPFVGSLYILIKQGFTAGDEGSNQYGPSPRPAFGNGPARVRAARSRDALSALPFATAISMIGSAITVSALLDLIAPSVFGHRAYGDYNYLFLLVLGFTAIATWLAGSSYSAALVDQWGLRRVSIGADLVTGAGILVCGLWLRSSLLVLAFVIVATIGRIAAIFAYRSMAPELATRIGLPLDRIHALFDAFPYASLLVVPFLFGSGPLRYWVWRLNIGQIEWVYAAFFSLSAMVVALLIPSSALAASPPPVAGSESGLHSTGGGPIEDGVAAS